MNKPKISTAWKDALRVWKGQFGGMLLFTLFQLILRLIALCPLLFLSVGQPRWTNYVTNPVAVLSEVPYRWLILLCPVLYLLLVLPARQSAAEAMQDALEGKPVFSPRMVFGGATYGQKLIRSLKTAFFMLLWALPFLALLGWTAQQFGGNEAGFSDGLTQLSRLNDFGGGDIVRGIVYAMLILMATTLPLFLGCAFHSGRRHEWALGEKRLVPGRRGGVMLAWFAGLAAYLPLMVVLLTFTRSYVADVVQSLKNWFSTWQLNLTPLDYRVWITAAAVLALLIPAVMLKRMVTAAYVRQLREEKA